MTTEAPPARGFLGTVFALWFEPRDAFEGILRSPGILVPLLVHFALVVAFSATWGRMVDPGEFMKTQLVESGRWDRMPPEARESVTTGSGGFFRTMIGVGAVFGGLGFPLLVAGTLLFVFRFFYASDVRFGSALSITAWSFAATGLVTTPVTLAVMYAKGEWNLPPPDVFQAGPALLVERGETAKPLWTLLQGLDFFTLWIVLLLAVGFAVASKRSTGSALWGVAVPWVLLVLCRAALAAF